MKNRLLPQEVIVNNKKLILDKVYNVNVNIEGYFILDLNRQFEHPDLECIPAIYLECNDKYQRYQIFKYNVVLGKREDLID
ncbi:hypothetical protein QTL86_07925 [Cellulosilyticum sp. ST5]|uniref:hypothetical protein n=1 Tax=unclassified Cellulosilyticum TaxID=2643091 RepID=UPI000F8E27F3|nr:hypothetical protein [Cellulosilyticum sp. WCF-2]QEH69050.1 hypothetical protein EKH84_11890 [Cellulosilyticum sp. WCF-2]